MQQPVGEQSYQDPADQTIQMCVPLPLQAAVEQLIQGYYQPDRAHPVELGSPVADPQALILAAIDKFIELRRSEWGQVGSQTGEFNPYVVRYDMLQKFRTAMERGELRVFAFSEAASLAEQIFHGWQHLARQAVPTDHYWGHPIPLPMLYGHLPGLTWSEFLSQLHQLDNPALELVPSRVKNWLVGDRLVGAITFHGEQRRCGDDRV